MLPFIIALSTFVGITASGIVVMCIKGKVLFDAILFGFLAIINFVGAISTFKDYIKEE